MEKRLVVECIKYVHDMCKIDNGSIEHFCELLECSEFELFSMFETLSQEHDFDLEDE